MSFEIANVAITNQSNKAAVALDIHLVVSFSKKTMWAGDSLSIVPEEGENRIGRFVDLPPNARRLGRMSFRMDEHEVRMTGLGDKHEVYAAIGDLYLAVMDEVSGSRIRVDFGGGIRPSTPRT